jgi:taurine dehydrogenase large subunit
MFSAGPGTGLSHPASYWAATAGKAPPDDGPAPARAEVDVAIIGGGYTGLSCAYHLARDHGVKSMVLEANRPGWGCSGRNGGFARMALGRLTVAQMMEAWGRDTAKRAFGETMASLNHVRELIRDGGVDCDASEAGHLKIAHRPGRAPELKAEAELLQRAGLGLDTVVAQSAHLNRARLDLLGSERSSANVGNDSGVALNLNRHRLAPSPSDGE